MRTYTRLTDFQADWHKQKISCVGLVWHYINRIAAHEHLNAFVEVFEEEALAKAQQLDDRLQKGEPLGPLAGMVIGIKDVICYKDHLVSAASGMLENFQSLYSATAVERLLAADAIIIGRLNCDEFGMGSTGENSVYGPVRNYYDTDKVAGGSSSGAAVAVQAELCMAALGTDTGGSVRQPASFCNVFGLKPTYGRVSRHGLVAYASSFDQIGILSHTAEDAALLLETIAGADDFDATCSDRAVEPYSQGLKEKSTPYRLAYLRPALEHPGLDPNIRSQLLQLFDRLTADGHTVEAVDFPHLSALVPTYYILTTAEAASNLSRYDGIRYGHRTAEANDLDGLYRKSRTEGFGKEVKRRILAGTFVLSEGYYDAYYDKAQRVRRLVAEATEALLEQYDFLLLPTTPTTAFNLGEKALQDPVATYLEDVYTVQASLAGVPAVSVPLFKHPNDLPFGLQILGKKFEEGNLLAFSHGLINEMRYHPSVVIA